MTPAGQVQFPVPGVVKVTVCWLAPDWPPVPTAYGTGVPAATVSAASAAYSPPPPPPPSPVVVRAPPDPPAPMHSALTAVTPTGGHHTPVPYSSWEMFPDWGSWNWLLIGVRAVPAVPMMLYTVPRCEAATAIDGGLAMMLSSQMCSRAQDRPPGPPTLVMDTL